MDNEIELKFLGMIEEKKDIIQSEENTKEVRKQKEKACKWIKEELLIVHGNEFTVLQLVKRLSNIQSRVKDKIMDAKGTGDGPPKTLSEADNLCVKILGNENPKISKVPGAIENTQHCGPLIGITGKGRVVERKRKAKKILRSSD